MEFKRIMRIKRPNIKKERKLLTTQQWLKLLAGAISLLITGILLQRGSIFVYSDKISKTIEIAFIVTAYAIIESFLLVLSKKGILGLDWIACASFMLCFQTTLQGETLYSQIAVLLTYCGQLFCLTNGLILFVKSAFEKYKKAKEEKAEFVDSVEGLISILTALVAVFFPIVEFLIK